MGVSKNMQRKLISFEAFERIQKDSLTNSYRELSEASDIVSEAFDVDIECVKVCNEDSVYYKLSDGTFLKANYKLDEDQIQMFDFEEVVIDEVSGKQSRMNGIREMLNAIIDENHGKAESCWEKIKETIEFQMTMNRGNSEINETKLSVLTKPKNIKKIRAAMLSAPKRSVKLKAKSDERSMKRKLNMMTGKSGKWNPKSKIAKMINSKGTGRARIITKECVDLTKNLVEFMSFKNSQFNEAVSVERNSTGAITSLSIPFVDLRNETKVNQFRLDSIKENVYGFRITAKKLEENAKFVKSVITIKRSNNLSDNEALEEALTLMVARFPEVVYLTESELEKIVENCLESVNEKNYSTETCHFISEAILMTAFDQCQSRVQKIKEFINISESFDEDPYQDFQKKVHNFYQSIDDQFLAENRALVDIYNTLSKIEKLAEEAQDSQTQNDVGLLLDTIDTIVESRASTDAIIEEATQWLFTFLETNLETSKWDVSEKPLDSADATMDKWASHSYAPASDFTAKRRPLQITGANEFGNEAENDGMSNIENSDTVDKLTNPYLPKSIKPKIPAADGESPSDSKDEYGDGDSDTNPRLRNPYLLNNLMPKKVV